MVRFFTFELFSKNLLRILNRLDEIILFDRLQAAQMGDIVDIQLGRLEKLLAARNMHIELDKAARHPAPATIR
ncbi:MAG: hypothetical protein EBT71_07730 [Alphaproteobacteria bacterium]|nr:hypothetical protein [Alphaproteobacteria bacterium]